MSAHDALPRSFFSSQKDPVLIGFRLETMCLRPLDHKDPSPIDNGLV